MIATYQIYHEKRVLQAHLILNNNTDNESVQLEVTH